MSKTKKKSGKLEIYQIYFRKDQRANLDTEFIPYFKAENEEIEWREYWTFRKNSVRAIKSQGLTGYLSWKFTAKSGVSAEKFKRFIMTNEGYDVYFINPFPMEALLFKNIWWHGEFYHPGLIEFCENIFLKIGYRFDIRTLRHSPEMVGYANYWVGNSKFWKKYMDFTRPLEEYIRHKMTAEESNFLYRIADPVSNCSHIPFIFERLFTSLLVLDPEIHFIAYQYDDADLRRRFPRAYTVAKILRHPFTRFSGLTQVFSSLIRVFRRLQKARKA